LETPTSAVNPSGLLENSGMPFGIAEGREAEKKPQTYWTMAGSADMDAIGQRPPLKGKVRTP
jgi:hypothetical protein